MSARRAGQQRSGYVAIITTSRPEVGNTIDAPITIGGDAAAEISAVLPVTPQTP
ncbi:hypothetical protein ACOJVU_09285 [Mycobacterium sp. THU-M104]|uniref:hypothetical protein n=1 Tax=Mycobacterium sp. THU-M104 TaxID=3410515 RepID=UPI003B9CF625